MGEVADLEGCNLVGFLVFQIIMAQINFSFSISPLFHLLQTRLHTTKIANFLDTMIRC